MAFEKITVEYLLCQGYTNAGSLICLVFSVIFCLLIIGNGKLSFETSVLPGLCWGFKMMQFMYLRSVVGFFVFVWLMVFCLDFLIGCFVVFGGKGKFDFQVWLPK